MDIYEDRTEWQMSDHDNYNTPLEWPENVFGEELGGGVADTTEPADQDDTEVVPPVADDDDDLDLDEEDEDDDDDALDLDDDDDEDEDDDDATDATDHDHATPAA